MEVRVLMVEGDWGGTEDHAHSIHSFTLHTAVKKMDPNPNPNSHPNPNPNPNPNLAPRSEEHKP